MKIDLRSDTVTQPSKAMLAAMFAAPVGDDVFAEDPTVNALEQKMANMFGMEAAIYCPSGTMTNQIGIKVLTQPLDEIICHKEAHIQNYELGGHGFHSGASLRLTNAPQGKMTAQDIHQNVRPDFDWYPPTKLVWVENTCNRAGGSFYTYDELKAVAHATKQHQLKLHLDGARLFNALVESGVTTQQIGELFDSVSICLSKGLGAPVGSVLLGTKKAIRHARRVRKVMGGGMRQAGYLAAAGIYALNNNIKRLKEDHKRAAILGNMLQEQAYVSELLPVHTNIVLFNLVPTVSAHALVQYLQQHNIIAFPSSNSQIRFVTHLNFTDNMLDKVLDKLQKYKA